MMVLQPNTAMGDHGGGHDPWADSVAESSGAVGDPEAATGPDDNLTTTLVGIGTFVKLNMGVNEEGTGALRIHFGVVSAQTSLNIILFNSDDEQIATFSDSITASTDQSREYSFTFNIDDGAYRYVRISSGTEGGFNIDAVEALNYIGKDNADTDGDGVPDRIDSNPQTKDIFPPSAPTISSAVPGDSRITVSWNAPSSSGGAAIIDYHVFRNGSQVASVVSGTFSYADIGLTNGATYSYTVDARNAAGTS